MTPRPLAEELGHRGGWLAWHRGQGWLAPRCHAHTVGSRSPSSFGKGDGFPECSLLPRPVPSAGAGRKPAGAVCFSPHSWQGAPQPKHTHISGRGWDLTLCLLCSLLQDELPPRSLPRATALGAPAVATGPTQAPALLLLGAFWCSCCLPAWGTGEYERFLLPARMPRAQGVSTVPGPYTLTAGTRGVS